MPEKWSENMSEEMSGKKVRKTMGKHVQGDVKIYMSRYVTTSIREFVEICVRELVRIHASMYILSTYKSHVRTGQKICPNSRKYVVLHGAKYGSCSYLNVLVGAGPLHFP